jgi:hypothetical protein
VYERIEDIPLSFHNLYCNSSVPGPIEFAEEYGLPCAEKQLPVVNDYRFRRTDKRGLDMGVRVAFGMEIIGPVGDQLI